MLNKLNVHESRKSIPYDVIAEKEAYHIVFNLPEQTSSSFKCFLNRDERHLVVVSGQKKNKILGRAPCIFKAPVDANLDEIRIQSRKSIHVISIPRLQKQALSIHSTSQLSQQLIA